MGHAFPSKAQTMAKRKHRNANDDLATGISYALMLLALAIGAPVIAWWRSVPPEGHIIMIAGVVALFVTGLALAWILRLHRRQQQTLIWARAMSGWQGSPAGSVASRQHSTPA